MKFKYTKKYQKGGAIIDFIKSDVYNNPIASVVKMVDPTGITSYGDIYNAWTDGKFDYNDVLEPIGAIPLIGKLGKGLKLVSKLENTGAIGKLIKNTSELSDAKKILNQSIPNPKAYRAPGGRMFSVYPGQPKYINPNPKDVINKAKEVVNYNKKLNYSQYGVRGIDAGSDFYQIGQGIVEQKENHDKITQAKQYKPNK